MEQPKTITETETPQVKIIDISIKDQNTALNVVFYFMTVAQKRGVFSLEESAKLWECMKYFQPKNVEKSGTE